MKGRSNIHSIPSLTDQRAFLTAEVAEVEEVAPSGGGLVHEEPVEIVELDMIVEVDDKD